MYIMLVASFSIFMKRGMIKWQWHQLDHVQIICTLFKTGPIIDIQTTIIQRFFIMFYHVFITITFLTLIAVVITIAIAIIQLYVMRHRSVLCIVGGAIQMTFYIYIYNSFPRCPGKEAVRKASCT